MTIFTGTAGNDTFNGSGGADTFDMFQGGRDEVFGGDSEDTFNFGAELKANDTIDGGTANDVLNIQGDYSGGLVFAAGTIESIETFSVGAGFDYDLTFREGNFSGTLTFGASALAAANRVIFDASADTDTNILFFGGDGDDVVNTGAGNDSILVGFGDDTANGGGGVDVFQFNTNSFGVGDFIDGGADTDFLSLVGDYSAGLTLTKTMINSIEVVNLGGSFDYDVTVADRTADGNLGFGLFGMAAGFSVVIDASAERHGTVSFTDSVNNDVLTGGHLADFFNISNGGKDTVEGRDGDDGFFAGDDFTAKDKIDGGDGTDDVTLDGDYSGGVEFRNGTMKSIETLLLTTGFSYSLTLANSTVTAGQTLTVNAFALGAGDTLVFDGSLEFDGDFSITGGGADDVITGGAGNDTIADNFGANEIFGGGGDDSLSGGLGDDDLTGGDGADVMFGANGADRMDGGVGADTYAYGTVFESTGPDCDTLLTFNANADFIGLEIAVTGVDAQITTGTLTNANFDDDLEAAVNSGNLEAAHAVIFIPSSGAHAGDKFLIIDANGGAGYQAGLDFVMEIAAGSNLASLSTANFI
jgi:hypothetical protein